MKQHITVEQLNELSDKGKERLRAWWKPQAGDLATAEGDGYRAVLVYNFSVNTIKQAQYPLLSVGQMMEFLSESEYAFEITCDIGMLTMDKFIGYEQREAMGSEELCDALWEAVKEELEDTNGRARGTKTIEK